MESIVSTDKYKQFLTINTLYHWLLMRPNPKLKQLLKTGKNGNLVITWLLLRYQNQNKFWYKTIHWEDLNYLLKYLAN